MTDTFHKETLNRLVIGLVGDNLAPSWWKSPNRAFEGRAPEELMNEEEWIRVRNYLMDSAYGGQYG